METNDKKHSIRWSKTLFVLCVALLATALYEMFWAWLATGNCCTVDAGHDFPLTLLLGLAAASLVLLRHASLSKKGVVGVGLVVIMAALLVEIPLKKYIGVDTGSDATGWYPFLPLISAAGVGIVAAGSTRILLPAILWALTLLVMAGMFFMQHDLIRSGWGVALTLITLAFQAWLFVRVAVLARKDA